MRLLKAILWKKRRMRRIRIRKKVSRVDVKTCKRDLFRAVELSLLLSFDLDTKLPNYPITELLIRNNPKKRDLTRVADGLQ